MTTWTTPAAKALDEHLEKLRESLQSSGADANEVADDLRRHIEEEARAEGLTVLTEQDVRRLLARAGKVESGPAPSAAAPPSRSAGVIKAAGTGSLYFFGVILPFLTLGLELATHMCAGVLFDPLPTWGHVLLVAVVPTVNLLVLRALRRPAGRHDRWLWRANGLVIAVATIYAILFLPFTPFAAIGVIYLGLGLLPLSPLLALIAGLRLVVHLRRLLPEGQRSGRAWWVAFSVGFACLVALSAPKPLTRHLAQLAVSEDVKEGARGIRWLRLVGSEEVLLSDCYGRGRRAEGEFNFVSAQPVPPEKARQLYFRVTGRAFNSVPPPQRKYYNRTWAFLDDFEWDDAVGGDAVAGAVKGLTLQQSRMDATCNTDEGWGYLEWTLEFRNDSALAREARAQIALPPGAVVSRLTLWVDGEEREAAFAGRSQVKQAYRQVVVVQRRDPVLVTTCGPDRVMMQCFPVPPQGGLMKVRLGVTVPLRLESMDKAVMEWPCFLERNFKFTPNLRHSLWLQSQQPVVEPGILNAQPTQSSSQAINGQVADDALARGAAVVRLRRDAAIQTVATPQAASLKPAQVVQTFRERIEHLPSRIVVVVDGSRAMREFFRDVAEALQTLPAAAEVLVLLARDDVADLTPLNGATTPAALLLRQRFDGGQDNVPMLTRGWELACEKTNSVLVWIHGPQPTLLDPADALRQSMEWRESSMTARVIELCVTPGPDRVAEKLDGIKSFQTLPREGSPGDRLRRLFAQWQGEVPVVESARTLGGTSDTAADRNASKHVARLWAKEEISRLIASRKHPEAIALAGIYQLVTPVSGAVVLENATQYKDNNLNPVDPATVPMVPEPSVILLLLAGTALAMSARLIRRARTGTTSP